MEISHVPISSWSNLLLRSRISWSRAGLGDRDRWQRLVVPYIATFAWPPLLREYDCGGWPLSACDDPWWVAEWWWWWWPNREGDGDRAGLVDADHEPAEMFATIRTGTYPASQYFPSRMNVQQWRNEMKWALIKQHCYVNRIWKEFSLEYVTTDRALDIINDR